MRVPAPARSGVAHALVSLALFAVCTAAQALPSFAEVKAAHRPSDLTLVDRHGTPIQTVRVDKAVRRLAWTPIAEMSPALLTAIVLSEDKRFWDTAASTGRRRRRAPGATSGTRERAAHRR
jgi:penicillin-binding protein 1C